MRRIKYVLCKLLHGRHNYLLEGVVCGIAVYGCSRCGHGLSEDYR